jgi:hypothetical protein
VSDEEIASALGRSIARRVRTVDPRPDADELLSRIDARTHRNRGFIAAAICATLLIGGLAGYAIGRSNDRGNGTPSIAALDDGVAPPTPSSIPYEPADIETAKTAIAAAFHAAYDGPVTESQRGDALQDGALIAGLRNESKARAEQFGYTAEQLAGTSIEILDTAFIDETHAVTHFTLSIPGHGQVLTDRVGYAVFIDGRWKVALRTSCDILSLNGLGRQCPPAP